MPYLKKTIILLLLLYSYSIKSQNVKVESIKIKDSCIFLAIEDAIKKDAGEGIIDITKNIFIRLISDTILNVFVLDQTETIDAINHYKPEGYSTWMERNIFIYNNNSFLIFFEKTGKFKRIHIKCGNCKITKKNFLVNSIIRDPDYYIYYYNRMCFNFIEASPNFNYFWPPSSP